MIRRQEPENLGRHGHANRREDIRGNSRGAALVVPNGPRGERRPADAIGRTVMVVKIATEEIDDTKQTPHPNKSKGGRADSTACRVALLPERQSEIARAAAAARW